MSSELLKLNSSQQNINAVKIIISPNWLAKYVKSDLTDIQTEEWFERMQSKRQSNGF